MSSGDDLQVTTGGQHHATKVIGLCKKLPFFEPQINKEISNISIFRKHNHTSSIWLSKMKTLLIVIMGLHVTKQHIQVVSAFQISSGATSKKSVTTNSLQRKSLILGLQEEGRTVPDALNSLGGGVLHPPRIDCFSRRSTALGMSSLQREKSNEEKSKTRKRVSSFLATKLPPPPEDQLSMIGDIGCLFLYSFLDHFVNKLYDKWMNSPSNIDFLSPSAAIESSSAASLEYSSNLISGSLSTSSLPVWFDPYSSAPFGNIPLSSALPLEHHITYAPAIEATGMASVLLCCSWLLSGYFTGAFRFQNTVECTTDRAILVTAKTWIFSSLIMLGIAWFSDSAVGCVNCLHKSVGITKADADYIFDSLSVLLTWRYILSSFFGYDNNQGPGDRRP